MRFSYPKVGIEIVLTDEKPTVFVIENQQVFSDIVESLWKQVNGQEGMLLLSDWGDSIRFDKKVEFICNPITIDCNDRKILNKIYVDATTSALDLYVQNIAELNAEIINFIDKITATLPYGLDHNIELDLTGLWKLYKLKVDEECTNRLDYLITYIKLLHQVNSIIVFAFLNLKQYFNDEEIEILYQACIYEHIFILDLEGYDPKMRNKTENYVILDKDLCFINCN